ncbi:MAG: hypothetical protein RL123_745 [Pseudomonadota bacterium]
MRTLVVLAHPAPESFAAALAQAVTEAARAGGHEVRLLDLCALGFDPVMGAEEWRGYGTGAPVPPDLAQHVAALRWAEAVVFVHPTWWQGPPAILKGWLDRVWRPGVAFVQPAPGGTLGPALTDLRLIGVVTTMAAPWWVATLVMGMPGRRMLLRGLRACSAPGTRTFWLSLHGIETADAPRRARFVARVRARIAAELARRERG